jgi:methionyl-tRNA formyltransferase
LLVVVAYGLILPQTVLDLPHLGCVNIHASLLPRWRGAAPIQRAILAGDVETGVSIMRLEAGLDTGPVYLERRVPIAPGMTAGELHDVLSQTGARALAESLPGLIAGTLVPQPQSAAGTCYAHKIEKLEARIEWARPAIDIERQVRAFNPWPVAETSWNGEQVRIHRARAVPEDAVQLVVSAPTADTACSNAGSALALRDDAVWVACGSGVLAVQELQRAGKRVVSAREFANATSLDTLRFGA